MATVLNINRGHNEAPMSQCRKLYEYAYLVNAVRAESIEAFIKQAE